MTKKPLHPTAEIFRTITRIADPDSIRGKLREDAHGSVGWMAFTVDGVPFSVDVERTDKEKSDD